MKILPLINYNIYNNLSAKFTPKYSQQHIPKLKADSFEVSFRGEKSYIEQAKDNCGIHCPICGKSMLNENELDKIIERASNIRNAENFKDILREYKDYIPESMKDILKGCGENAATETDFYEYFNKLSKNAYLRHKRHIESANNFILEYSKTQTPEKQTETIETLKNIKYSDSQYTYSKKVSPLLKSFVVPTKKEYLDLLNNTTLSLNDSGDYLYVFKIPNTAEKTPGEIASIMAERIFSKSLMESSKISRTWDTENPNNEILTCRSCSSGSSAKTFIKPTELTRPDLKENIRKYLQDISITMGQKNLVTNSPYITYLVNFIYKITQHQITFSPDEILTIKKLNHIATRHSDFTPISQTKTDVPCAGCGSTMLQHEIKKQIEDELNKRATIKGYIGILQKYDKYIGTYAHPAADIILELYNTERNISKNEFVKKVQAKMDEYTNARIDGIMQEFERLRPHVHRKNTPAEAKNYDKIFEETKRIINTPKFQTDFNYKDYATELTEIINLTKDIPVGVYTLLNKIKIACFENSLVKINEFDKTKDKDSLQTILFKMFNSNLGTTDHFVAMNKGGQKDITNMIGLCRTCNSVVKGDKRVYSWYAQNREINENFLNQLMVIDAMARRKEIEGFDNWAQTIAEKMYQLTYGKYDIRRYFDDPK